MLTYSTSDVQQLTALTLANPDDPQVAITAYSKRVQTMRDYANNIDEAGLRGKLCTWSTWTRLLLNYGVRP